MISWYDVSFGSLSWALCLVTSVLWGLGSVTKAFVQISWVLQYVIKSQQSHGQLGTTHKDRTPQEAFVLFRHGHCPQKLLGVKWRHWAIARCRDREHCTHRHLKLLFDGTGNISYLPIPEEDLKYVVFKIKAFLWRPSKSMRFTVLAGNSGSNSQNTMLTSHNTRISECFMHPM